jgi:ubiquinone/menaquinone biosynthesis C-methylase UbiE
MRQDPYRFVARWYDKIFGPMNRGLRLLGLRMFRPREGMSILDVGCGTGAHLELYQRYRCHMYGIDPSPAMIQVARERLGDRAEFHLGDASDMPYENRSFDLVICMLALHEMNPPTRSAVIGEMKRVLKHTGRILLIDFHPAPVRPFKSWLARLGVLFSEIAAGREHFRNYRHFMSIQGLPALITEHALVVEKQKVVGGGALALFLLRTLHPCEGSAKGCW